MNQIVDALKVVGLEMPLAASSKFGVLNLVRPMCVIMRPTCDSALKGPQVVRCLVLFVCRLPLLLLLVVVVVVVVAGAVVVAVDRTLATLFGRLSLQHWKNCTLGRKLEPNGTKRCGTKPARLVNNTAVKHTYTNLPNINMKLLKIQTQNCAMTSRTCGS